MLTKSEIGANASSICWSNPFSWAETIVEDKTKTIQELDREKLEKKFSKDDKEKLN